MKNQKLKLKSQNYSFLLAFFTVVFFLLSLIFTPPKICAQELSLSLTPPLLEVMIKPGKSLTQAYTISNHGAPLIVEAKIAEFTDEDIRWEKDFTPEKWISTINTNLSFDRPFLLRENEERQLIVKIAPPKETEEKDYYRAIIFTTHPLMVQDTSSSAVSQTLVSPLLITVTSTGLLPKSAQIVNFAIPFIHDSFTPLNITLDVKNTGKTYFRPVGTIELKNFLGKISYNLVPRLILSGQTKRLTTEIFSAENMNSQTTLFLPGLFIGKYQLTADFTLDQGKFKITQTKYFYAFPWKIILVLIIFFLFTRQILIWFRLIKHANKPLREKK